MRLVVPIVLALLLAGCALPFGLHWPRLPWQKPRPKPESCIIAIDPGSAQGITVGGEAKVQMPCRIAPSAPPQPQSPAKHR